LVQSLSLSLSGDRHIDELMHHYIVHVADLLQPIRHPENPYRNLYAPAALEAASSLVRRPLTTKAKAHSVLYHSLLSSSAFHLWSCNPRNSKYHEIGTQNRQRALALLHSAITPTKPPTDYKSLLMAMLSLVTIGVMSGQSDFAVHLNGTQHLRQLRLRWRVVSRETQQLNEISAFLALLAQTLSFHPSPLPWSDGASDNWADDPAFNDRPGSCFPYMYGITSSVTVAIQKTCRLSEFLLRCEANQEPIPDGLLDACETLGEQLLSWSFELEAASFMSTSSSEMGFIFKNHAQAWHTAALIYYYHRIQRYGGDDLVDESERVAEYMHAIEEAKAQSKVDETRRMAPITWPAFIASCQAMNRGRWREWWERVQHYGIANIKRQWEIVQHIWRKRDMIKQAGINDPGWMDIFQDLKINIL
ncbi:hypothetical protein GQ53DRAFT_586424, partial [Thozetella sp. PMI_491]